MTDSPSCSEKKTIEDLYLEWAGKETLQMLRFPEMVLSVSEDLRAIYSEDDPHWLELRQKVEAELAKREKKRQAEHRADRLSLLLVGLLLFGPPAAWFIWEILNR